MESSYHVHVFLFASHFFRDEKLASQGSDTIFKLSCVSYAPPNCEDPLVKGNTLISRYTHPLIHVSQVQFKRRILNRLRHEKFAVSVNSERKS